MKYLTINQKNSEKIMQVFAKKQGRAKERTIDKFNELIYICKDVEQRLCISKKALNGTMVVYDFRQTFPIAYRYRPMSTHFILLFDKNKWYIDIDSISRVYTQTYVKTGRYSMYGLLLSDTAKEAILASYK